MKRIHTTLKKRSVLCVAVLAIGLSARAQRPTPNYYVGLGGGLHSSSMKFSNLDNKKFPSNSSLTSGEISFFGEIDFLKNHSLAIRPQFSFLRRGGKLTDIDKLNWSTIEDETGESVSDVYYKLHAQYFDIRIPVLWQFGRESWIVRPYAGIAPVLGFAYKGEISYMTEFESRVAEGYRLDLSKGNMKGGYFAMTPMAGAKINLPIGGLETPCFIGVEVGYEIGLTNTYGKDKKGESLDVVTERNRKLSGTRKFRGVDFNVTVGIPLSAFRKKTEPKPQPIVQHAPIVQERTVVEAPKPVVEEPKQKPCYTLEEIDELIDNNESVVGKTICAIDAISFDFNKSTIKRESYPYLQHLAKTLIRTEATVDVKGHTDNVGKDTYNMELSKNRAKAVRDYLVRQGVDTNNITYSYYGASRPLTDNDTEEHRAMNRRVEFEILK